MMKSFLAVVLLVSTASFATTINFDDLADGTAIGNHYAGVTFSCIVCTSGSGSGDAYARTTVNAASGSNVVSLFQTGIPVYDARYGAVQAKFDVGQQSVSIDAAAVPFVEGLGTPTSRPYMSVYDTNGNFITNVYYSIAYGDAAYGNFETLSYTSTSANIGSVYFTSQANQPYIYGLFDNLSFGAGDSGPGAPVPEPASLVLLGSGVLTLARKLRK